MKVEKSQMSRERIGDVAEILLDYFEHNKTFQTDKIMTVPAATYVDPDQRRAEIDLIFKRVPLMLALSCEMPRPGDYKAMEAVGLPVLITRDKSGTVRAFLNVCAHRWSPVAAEGYGNCPRFTCRFHGWTYGADGRLIGITDRGKFGEVDRSTHGLKELPCGERHGMIFVCLTPGTPLDLDGYYGALLEEYAYTGLEDWAFLGARVIEGANWKITLNNFFESYHFATLHPKTVATELISNMTHYEGFGPNMRLSLSQRTIAKMREVPRAQWGEQEGRNFGFIRFFFPNVTGSLAHKSSLKLSLFTQTFPAPTPDKSRTVLLYARKDPPKDEADRENLVREINYLTSDITYDEDVAIGIQIQKGLESGAHQGLLYGRNERGNQYFHEWLNWYLQGDRTIPNPVM
jgi:phenylpropionate dioxygenase-like ring-hydroxylating dioxygenase large terminal subunit